MKDLTILVSMWRLTEVIERVLAWSPRALNATHSSATSLACDVAPVPSHFWASVSHLNSCDWQLRAPRLLQIKTWAPNLPVSFQNPDSKMLSMWNIFLTSRLLLGNVSSIKSFFPYVRWFIFPDKPSAPSALDPAGLCLWAFNDKRLSISVIRVFSSLILALSPRCPPPASGSLLF